jgi:hypothetical protein
MKSGRPKRPEGQRNFGAEHAGSGSDLVVLCRAGRNRAMKIRNILIALAVCAVTAGFLGFTSPGQQILSVMGFATAGCSKRC